jgi:hypothetical protein
LARLGPLLKIITTADTFWAAVMIINHINENQKTLSMTVKGWVDGFL